MSKERAILAGGCFWGMQDLIRKKAGVLNTRVGYTGGEVENATYRNHGSHAEAIEIEFDNTVISYRDILAFFFQIHDPSTVDRQGNDLGTQYRSAIYVYSDEQVQTVEKTKQAYQALLGGTPITTEILPAGPYYYAENYHQQYLAKNPDGYCGLGGTGICFPPNS